MGIERGRGAKSEKVEMDGGEAGESSGEQDSDMSEVEYHDNTRVRKISGWDWSEGEIKR